MTEVVDGRPAVPFTANGRTLHLTMLYADDAETIARILAMEDVNRELNLVPTPYTIEDAHSWLRLEANDHIKFQQVDWSDVSAVSALLQEAIPMHAIRDESGQMIGSIDMRRSTFELIQDTAEKAKLVQANRDKPSGDEMIEYTLGYYLDPSAQKCGVMTAAVSAILQLARRYMHARHVAIYCRPTNAGSRAVARKNGFTLSQIVETKWKNGKAYLAEEWRIDMSDVPS